MNNKEFISELARRMGYKTADTQKKVYQVIDAMSERFQEGHAVAATDFGTFEVKKKMERIMKNPASGQRMLIPPKLVLGFRPGSAWKEKLKNGGTR